ncbi:hypothetical protein [Streptomyces antimycoticus]|uniref:hypothetical protein n=1 Tax=Streptomyces antimycoticus TaxID=68175 RepID=UPI0036B6DBC8
MEMPLTCGNVCLRLPISALFLRFSFRLRFPFPPVEIEGNVSVSASIRFLSVELMEMCFRVESFLGCRDLWKRSCSRWKR